MKEQIFAGDTGFDKLTAMKAWCVQGDTLNVFDYKGTPLFLLSEVLHCLYRDDRVVYKVGSTVRDILFGCRVKLSDVSAAKKVSKGRVSSNSRFTTIEGIERLIDPERKTSYKPNTKTVENLRKLFKTLQPKKVQPSAKKSASGPAQMKPQGESASALKVVSLPLPEQIALDNYNKAKEDKVSLREAIVKLSCCPIGTEALLDEYECLARWLDRAQIDITDALGANAI